MPWPCPQSRTLQRSGFSSASSSRSSELLLLKHLQHIPRPPASLRSVRSLWGVALRLQIQRTNAVAQSHKSRLHWGLETLGTTLRAVCLQTPERRQQPSVNFCGIWTCTRPEIRVFMQVDLYLTPDPKTSLSSMRKSHSKIKNNK